MNDTPPLDGFPLRTSDKLRYGDTDRQGHVNNAVFATLLESGRVDILYDADNRLLESGCAFVIARLEIDFKSELTWPGVIDVGTAVARIGGASLELSQVLYQGDRCAAVSRSIIVQMNETSRASQRLSDHARLTLGRWLVGEAS